MLSSTKGGLVKIDRWQKLRTFESVKSVRQFESWKKRSTFPLSKEIQTRGRGILINRASQLGPTSNLMRLVFSSVTSTQTGQGVSAKQVVACEKKLVCLSSFFCWFRRHPSIIRSNPKSAKQAKNEAEPTQPPTAPTSHCHPKSDGVVSHVLYSRGLCSPFSGWHRSAQTCCCYQIFCGSRQYVRD